MGNKIIFVIEGIVGLGVGAAGAWFFTKRHYEKKNDAEIAAYKDFYEKKLAAYKDFYEKKLAGLELRIKMLETGTTVVTTDSEKKSETNEPSSDKEDDRTDPGKITIPKPKVDLSKNDRPAYRSIIREQYDLENLTVDDEDEAVREAAEYMRKVYDENPIEAKPHLISLEAFCGDDDIHYKTDYNHISLDYYAGDDVLASMDTNEPVNNIGEILGYEWKLHFGDEEIGNDEDCVYVRNDQLRCDYEIIRDKGYYCQIILGIDPPDEDLDDSEE